jgi:iron-sulfur cluster assembly protein
MTEALQPAHGEENAPALPGREKAALAVAVSDAAAEYARAKLEKRGTPGAAVRLGVKGAGCSGFSYVIQFEDDPPRERDRVFEHRGVRFVVDKKSLIFLAGSRLDYEKTLMFQGFKFKNPQEASTCGCGHSFTVK